MDSKRVLGEVLSLAPDAVVAIDEDQHIVLFSRGAEKIFGVSESEVLGKPLDLLLPETTRPEHREYVRAFAESGVATRLMGERGEIVGRRYNGELFPAEASITRLEVDGQRLYAAVLRDVSERKQLLQEQAAREGAEAAAAQFRFLAEAGALLGSSLDIEVTLRNITRLAVPRISDWCSLDLVEAHGGLRRVEVAHSDPEREEFAREVYRLYPADPKARNAPALALQRGEPILLPDFTEELLVATARDPRHLELLRSFGFRSAMVVPMMTRDRIIGLITLATAESQRRFGPDDVALVRSLANRAALAIENAHLFEQARAAARAREEAVATVSHDLRTPLSVAITNVSLLREEELPPGERTRALERLDRALSGMRRMIETLLDVARLEAGAVKLDVQEVQAAALLVEACELVHPAAAIRSVTLVHEAEAGLRARGDHDRVVQVLCNLIENAVRHSPEHGRVRVWARSMDGRALFCVADEGPGVPEELRDRIFQRFWRQDANSRQGAGLGLAIARGLVELHGGRIWVESPESGGARFYFTLESEGIGGAEQASG